MENDIRQIAKYETKCTGCGACVNVCPVHAIKLVERNGYFLFPEIDQSKCTHCGLCLKKCPAAVPRHEPSARSGEEVAYGCYVKDDEIRAKSASGGVFQALARKVLSEGGAVCGARFVDEYKVEHVVIEREADLAPLICTKYVQSDPKNVYREIAQLLANGRTVLFVGTPCQVAAVKSVVGPNVANLLTVDLFCAGVPPYGLLKNHLEYIAGDVSRVTRVRFRDKNPTGWKECRLSFDFDSCTYSKAWRDDTYLRGFLEYLTIRKSCGKCSYAKFPRQGDLSIGDLWTIAERDLMWMDDKGVSAVIVNTGKGAQLFDGIKKSFAKIKRISLDELSHCNNIESHSYLHPNAHRFWAKVVGNPECDTDALIEEYLKKDDGVCVLNFADAHANYGSVLTAYALQQKIKKLIGYEPVNVHLWPSQGGDAPLGDLIEFNRENIVSSRLIRSRGNLEVLNRHFKTFIVGPDTVWYNCGFTFDFNMFLFNFARFSKNICSYAASFCFPYLINLNAGTGKRREVSGKEIGERKRLMKRFAHISVREDSGVTLCREKFDVEAEHVLDAVFLLKAEDYNGLLLGAPDLSVKHGPATYILYPSKLADDLNSAINALEDVNRLREGGDFDRDRNSMPQKGATVAEYLRGIRDCSCFITDSFHGLCFALIFRKQFILLHPSDSYVGSERLESLIRMLNIPKTRFVTTADEFRRALSEPIDYADIEPRLNEWIAKSEDYLKRVLADNKPNKTRDWLESVEMSIEELRRKLPPPRLTAKQQAVRIVKGVARRARSLGIVTDEEDGTMRTFCICHIPVLRVEYAQSGRGLSVFGVKIKKG